MLARQQQIMPEAPARVPVRFYTESALTGDGSWRFYIESTLTRGFVALLLSSLRSLEGSWRFYIESALTWRVRGTSTSSLRSLECHEVCLRSILLLLLSICLAQISCLERFGACAATSARLRRDTWSFAIHALNSAASRQLQLSPAPALVTVAPAPQVESVDP